MLSQKLQDDLMSAYQKVYESKRGHAAGDSDVEKQASQLASDVKYKAKGKVKPGASDEEKKKIYMQILSASPAPNAVKAMAKSKILGEEVVLEDKKMSRQSDDDLAAAHKKFSGMDQSTPSNKFMLKRIEKEMKKRKSVKEGTSYGLYKGTGKPKGAMKDFLDKRAKKLEADQKKQKKEYRNNPAFGDASHHSNRKNRTEEVELVDERTELKRLNYGNAVVGQKKGKEQTVKSKKAIPTGGDGTAYMGEAKKAKKDYDGDGKVESGTQEFLGSRDKAIKKAIAKRRGRYNEGFSAWRIDLDFNESVKK